MVPWAFRHGTFTSDGTLGILTWYITPGGTLHSDMVHYTWWHTAFRHGTLHLVAYCIQTWHITPSHPPQVFRHSIIPLVCPLVFRHGTLFLVTTWLFSHGTLIIHRGLLDVEKWHIIYHLWPHGCSDIAHYPWWLLGCSDMAQYLWWPPGYSDMTY